MYPGGKLLSSKCSFIVLDLALVPVEQFLPALQTDQSSLSPCCRLWFVWRLPASPTQHTHPLGSMWLHARDCMHGVPSGWRALGSSYWHCVVTTDSNWKLSPVGEAAGFRRHRRVWNSALIALHYERFLTQNTKMKIGQLRDLRLSHKMASAGVARFSWMLKLVFCGRHLLFFPVPFPFSLLVYVSSLPVSWVETSLPRRKKNEEALIIQILPCCVTLGKIFNLSRCQIFFYKFNDAVPGVITSVK